MSETSLTLSGLADEIDSEINTQLEVLADNGFRFFELRGIEDTNVLDLSSEQIDRIHTAIERYELEVSAIASPIGKVDITADFNRHLERFERAVELANEFDTEYIRLFSYYYPDEDSPGDWRDEVMRRMERKAEIAEQAGVILVHENERDIYGDTPERCVDIIETVNSPNLRALFDPANFVVEDIEAYPHSYEQLSEYIEYVHVKDANFSDDVDIVPAGKGEASLPGVVKALIDDGYDGFASLEPHLAHAGSRGGFSGPEAFEVATDAFKTVLDETDVSYD